LTYLPQVVGVLDAAQTEEIANVLLSNDLLLQLFSLSKSRVR
jgi:hypothetical protein